MRDYIVLVAVVYAAIFISIISHTFETRQKKIEDTVTRIEEKIDNLIELGEQWK